MGWYKKKLEKVEKETFKEKVIKETLASHSVLSCKFRSWEDKFIGRNWKRDDINGKIKFAITTKTKFKNGNDIIHLDIVTENRKYDWCDFKFWDMCIK